ncbi:cytochrome c oxidase subunit I [Xylanimonas oleitrophica]|uniref:cytochrome-c oxidase n=1 Tax=Xylanimonas oleitrophica TaxID=2607479 RepID=A0A2W5Y4P0_9MICO|nr:cytochrome c oxidase subunit I [Xylanimonas oleitrophica]PZR52954.1 cytochrome c oxidase subunit I [Xylanimonas oleitrophica]
MTTTEQHPPQPRAEAQFEETWHNPRGLRGFFTSVQHKSVGARYMVTAFVFFFVGGLEALFLRVQLAQPEQSVLSPQAYNELFTMHGTTMMFLFAVPFLEGLAAYLLPLQIGARDMPFARYNVFNYWCYLLAGIILYSSFLVDLVPDAGWFAYVPLSGAEFSDKGMDIWLFGLALAELAAIGAALEIIVAVLKMRAPGMSLDRMPIFAWTMLCVALLIIVAFVPLLVGSLLLELDRNVGTAFFEPARGGDPLLWQHLFWIFGHPEVYVMFLPGAAIISQVVPVHSRRRLVAYPFVVAAVVVTAIMSLGLWVHHMYTTGLPPVTLSFFTAASMSIAVASGVQVVAWLVTMWEGRPRLTVPMLFSLGFLFTFVAGGITGVMVASAPFDAQVHDSYFVVAHFHYVIIGGMLFPVLAGLFHWWPKMTGRMPSHRLGVISFWLAFAGFHLTFFPMHLTGMWGMPRRVFTYDESMGIGFVNLLSTVGAFVFAAGMVLAAATLVRAARRGERAPADPWQADTLEWATASPPGSSNFPRIPVVSSRTPLWNPAVPADDPEAHRMAAAFDHAPTGVRATPFTTVLGARPDTAAVQASPTVLPLVPALGLAVIAAGILVEVTAVVVVGAVLVVGGLVAWGVVNERELGQAEAREPIGGTYLVEAPGPRSPGWWGAVGAGTVLLVGATTLAFCMLYLQVHAPVWPPGRTLDQPWLTAATGVALAAAVAAAWWGSRQGRHAHDAPPVARAAHLASAGLTLLAGVAALVLLGVTWAVGDVDPTGHAYGSGVLTMLASLALAVLMGLGLTVAAVMARLRHERDVRVRLMLQNSALLWGCVVLVWAITWVTTDLLPAVIS